MPDPLYILHSGGELRPAKIARRQAWVLPDQPSRVAYIEQGEDTAPLERLGYERRSVMVAVTIQKAKEAKGS